MNRALCWKEWREHWLIWLTMAMLAGVLVPALAQVLSPLGPLNEFTSTRETLIILLIIFGVAYGTVCGALMFAGEQEAGTLPFLDALAGRRDMVWRVKVLFGGGLAIAQGLFLAGVDALVGVTPSERRSPIEWATFFVMLVVNAYAWGLFASARCRSVMLAASLGAGCFVGSWLVGVFTAFVGLNFAVGQTLLAGAAVAGSWRTFCRTNLERRGPVRAQVASASPGNLRVLLWLLWRQGRVVLAVLAGAGVFVGALLPDSSVAVWPIATLLVGLVCGTAVFAGDQSDLACRFLGSRRLPPGRVWAVKICFWLAAAAGIAGLILLAAVARMAGNALADPARLAGEGGGWLVALQRHKVLSAVISPDLFLIVWPLYGFAAGQLFVLLFRKSVVAAMVAAVAAAILSGVWLPSLVQGGVTWWQVLGVPVLLLAATRLLLWDWFCDTLRSRRALLRLASCVLLAAAWLAGALCYRIVEVPVVGAPFDVAEFTAELRKWEQNGAGQRVRQALVDRLQQLPQDDSAPRPMQELGKAPPNLDQQMQEVLRWGWPEGRPELDRWLDRRCAGEWVNESLAIERLPLGLIVDPRRADVSTPFSPFNYFIAGAGAANDLTARALQLQSRGEHSQALDHLWAVLALSRQLRNAAGLDLYKEGITIERLALRGLDLWLQKLGPRKALLRRAVDELARHEAETPPLSNCAKAEYLMFRNSLLSRSHAPPLENALIRVARETPWEEERESRLLNAIFTSRVRQASADATTLSASLTRLDAYQAANRSETLAFSAGIEPGQLPESGLSLEQWSTLIASSRGVNPGGWWIVVCSDVARSLQLTRGSRVQMALALYQAEQGRPAGSLNDLTPRYLPTLPADPFTGQPFAYHISKGEKIAWSDLGIWRDEDFLEIAAGQGVVTCRGRQTCVFVVPLLPKR